MSRVYLFVMQVKKEEDESQIPSSKARITQTYPFSTCWKFDSPGSKEIVGSYWQILLQINILQ